MVFGLCQPRRTSTAPSKTAPPAQRPDVAAAPAKSATSAPSFEIPLLVEVRNKGGICQPAPATSSPRPANGIGEGSFSVSKSTMLEDGGSPLWAPGTRVFDVRNGSKASGDFVELGGAAADGALSSSFRRGPDVWNGTRDSSFAAPSGGACPFSPRDTPAGGLHCFSAAVASATANAVASRTRSTSGPAGACRLNSILRPSSRWAEDYSPLAQNLPLSEERRSLSLCSAPLTTLTPCRGSVRFLGSDDKDAESTDVAMYESAKQGEGERRPRETLPGAGTLVGAPAAQASYQHAPHPLIAEQAGSDGESAKWKANTKLCISVPESGETPSPWASVHEPASGPSNHVGLLDSLTPSCVGDTNDQFGLFNGDGGSGEMPPVAGPTPTSPGAFQPRRSILLRPSANTSGISGSSVPPLSISPLWQDSKAVGHRRASRRWQGELDRCFSERRPSFTLAVPHRSSGFRQHRLSRSEDSSSDDEHIIATVCLALLRLKHADSVRGGRSSVPGRLESRMSSAEIEAHALRTAARIGDATHPELSAGTKTESSLPMSSSATSESSRARPGRRTQASVLGKQSPI
ncbi:hypothetical protein LSCM1_01576 [Leishmania martiniquensis]|uniref:Uncharacterized protein n=1 Tax=Leishmania martiniquensis TaxID=1580590 RepID=A0A836KCN8_9TRYP|nr:hypothetical protein LSCM1_01576 [Leishmania martiniquensis]